MKVKKYIFLVAAIFSVNANADLCPAKSEVIVTTPYKSTTTCPATTIIIEGERNPDKYESCLGDVPYAREQVFYQAKGKEPLPLPKVNSLLPPNSEESFKLRLWVVGSIKPVNVKCEGKNVVSIGFWGGGNCNGCEQAVKYTFGHDGQLKNAKLK